MRRQYNKTQHASTGTAEDQIRQQLMRRASLGEGRTAKQTCQALAELHRLEEGNAYEQLAAWYYLNICTGYGYAIKLNNEVKTLCGWLRPAEITNYIGNRTDLPSYLAVKPATPLTSWAAIDIDISSRYHPTSDDGEGIEPVIEAMTLIGLEEPLEFQSSHSGGIHLWYPLGEAYRTWDLARAMRSVCAYKGVEERSGVLELRPNVKTYDSNYQAIRAPLTGEGNAIWIETLGLVEELVALRNEWSRVAYKNKPRPPVSPVEPEPIHKNIKRKTNNKNNGLKKACDVLERGFTGPGQTQQIKLAALQKARLMEGIEDIDKLEERVLQIIQCCPGYEIYCGHRSQIESGTFLCKWELTKALSLKLGGYIGTWKEVANQKKSTDAHDRAAAGLANAVADGHTFRSELEAIRYIQNGGGPSRSWWKKDRNKAILERLRGLIR
jgi:hypothetical protein